MGRVYSERLGAYLDIPNFSPGGEQDFIPPASEPTQDYGWGEWAGDLGNAVMGRFADYGTRVGDLMQIAGQKWQRFGFEGLVESGEQLSERSSASAQWWEDRLSQEFRDILSTPYRAVQPDGSVDYDFALGKVLTDAIGSMPATFGGLRAGQLVTKGIQTLAAQTGKIKALQIAAKAGDESAKAGLKFYDRAAGIAGFGTGEGAVAAAFTATETFGNVMDFDHETLISDSPRYAKIYNAAEMGDEAERQDYAKRTLASEAASDAGWKAFLTTAALGAPTGALFGRAFGRPLGSPLAKTKAAQAATGIVGEAAQEFGQEGAEEYFQQSVTAEFTGQERPQDFWDNVLNAAVGGAASGALMGGAFGAVQGESIQKQAKRKVIQDFSDTWNTINEKGLHNEAQAILGWRERGVGTSQLLRGLKRLAETGEIPSAPYDIDRADDGPADDGPSYRLKLSDLDPKLRTKLQAKLDLAVDTASEFESILDRSTSAVPNAWHMGPLIKAADSAADKVGGKYNGDVERIQDLLRSTIVIQEASQGRHVLNNLTMQGMRFSETPRTTLLDDEVRGYRDIQAQIVHSNGLVSEVQVNTPQMLLGKSIGHDLYVQQRDIDRSLPEGAVRSPEQQAAWSELQRLQEDFYDVVNRVAEKVGFEEVSEAFAVASSIDDSDKPKFAYDFLRDNASTADRKVLKEVAEATTSLSLSPRSPSEVTTKKGPPGGAMIGAPSSSTKKREPSGGLSGSISATGERPLLRAKDDIVPRKEGETYEEYMERVVDQEPAPAQPLPDNPDLYFERGAETEMVPVEQAIPRKGEAEVEESRVRAARRMLAAAQGRLGRRPPLSGVRMPDGSWLILDGNSTLGAARDSGFAAIPVKEVTDAETLQQHQEVIEAQREKRSGGETDRGRDVQQDQEVRREARDRAPQGRQAPQAAGEEAAVGVAERYTRIGAEASQEAAEAAVEDEVRRHAAEHPDSDFPAPTADQVRSGNYPKGHLKLQGLNISIENPRGSVRRGHGFSRKLRHHYGYISSVKGPKGAQATMGRDKDYLDVFLGPAPHLPMRKIYVVDQVRQDGSLDEHKVMLGFESEGAAKSAYMSEYPTGWHGLGAITPMSQTEFKRWTVEGDKTKGAREGLEALRKGAADVVKQAIQEGEPPEEVPRGAMTGEVGYTSLQARSSGTLDAIEEAARRLDNLSVRAESSQERSLLSQVSRGLHAAVAEVPSADARAALERQLSELRESLPAAREIAEEALRALREPGQRDAPRGLQQAAGGDVAVSGVSSDGARQALNLSGETPENQAKPGEQFIFYRLGRGRPSISNDNAANLNGIARFLKAVNDDGPVNSRATTLAVYRVTAPKEWGPYALFREGKVHPGITRDKEKRIKEGMARPGKGIEGEAIQYSAPGNKLENHLIGKVELEDVEARLKEITGPHESRFVDVFGDASTEQVEQAIRESFENQIAPKFRLQVRRKPRPPPAEPVAPETREANLRRLAEETKVVNEDGSPKVVYFGNVSDFSQFDPGQRGSRTGDRDAKQAFFFTDRPGVASRWSVARGFDRPTRQAQVSAQQAKVAYQEAVQKASSHPNDEVAYEDMKRLQKTWRKAEDQFVETHQTAVYERPGMVEGANVMPLYLRMTNPLIVDMKGGRYSADSYSEAIRRAKQKMKDGVIFKNVRDEILHPDPLLRQFLGSPVNEPEPHKASVYAVFDPKQIKSATANLGTFDFSHPDIRYRLRDDEATARRRPPQPGSMTLEVMHLDKKEGLSLLMGNYGQGHSAEERHRLADAPDYLQQRSYHYVMDEPGAMPQYERLVATTKKNLFRTRLTNIFDGSRPFKDRPLHERAIVSRAEAREKQGENFGNAIEDEVYKAGYDGMRVGNVAVYFGAGLPVRAAGTVGHPHLERNPEQNIVSFETITEGSPVLNQPPHVQDEYSREVMVTVDGGRDLLAEALGFDAFYTYASGGAYAGTSRPNWLAEAPNAEAADIYSKAVRYIYDQEAVGWFRALTDPNETVGAVFDFRGALNPEAERAFMQALQRHIGKDAAYTRTDATSYTVVNFRDESGEPFAMDDDSFMAAVEAVSAELEQDLTDGKATITNYEAGYVAESEEASASALRDWGGENLFQRVRDWRDEARSRRKDFEQRLLNGEGDTVHPYRITRRHRAKAKRLYDPSTEKEFRALRKKVEKEVQRISKAHPGMGRVRVMRNPYGQEIPHHIRSHTLSLPTEVTPEALFDPVTGDIYIFSDFMAFDEARDPRHGIHSIRDKVERAVFEEMMHQGLRRAFGAEFDQFLNLAAESLTDEQLAPIAATYRHLDPNDPKARVALVEEYIAKMDPAENPSLWEKFVAWVRDWARRHGFKWAQNLNGTDLRRITREVYEGIQSGRIERPSYRGPTRTRGSVYLGPDGVMYAIHPGQEQGTPAEWEPPSDSEENFKRWFGDSKVVDEDGGPLVVYHGTAADIDSFGKQLNGGYYFVASPDLASDFAAFRDYTAYFEHETGQVIPVFLSIENPLIVDAEGKPLVDVEDEAIASAESQNKDGVIIRNATMDTGVRYTDRGLEGKEFDTKLPEDYTSRGPSDVYIAFRPEQVKSSVGNKGYYDPASPDIRYRVRRRKGTPAQEAVIEQTMGGAPEDLGLWDRVKMTYGRAMAAYQDNGWWGFKQAVLDQQAAIERYERMENGGKLLDAAESAYKMAALTQNHPGVFLAMLRAGVPEYRDGSFVGVEGRRGIGEVFGPLWDHESGESLLPLWEGYAAARAAQELIEQQNPDGTQREKLFSQDMIDEMLALEKEYPEFRDVFDGWLELNQNALDLAESTGALDPEERAMWRRNMYVPFYRAMDDIANINNPVGEGRGLAGTFKAKRLYGSERRLDGVFENMLINLSTLVDRSYKAAAMHRVADLGERQGVMERVPMPMQSISFTNEEIARALLKAGLLVGTPMTPQAVVGQRALEMTDEALAEAVKVVDEMTDDQRESWTHLFRRVRPVGNDIVSVMRNGKPVYYRVLDPSYLQAIHGLNQDHFGKIMEIAGMAKRVLTKGVTSTPGFMFTNMFRDTLSTWLVSDLPIPFQGFLGNAKEIWNEDGTALKIMFAGGSTHGFHGVDKENLRKAIYAELGPKQGAEYLKTLVNPFDPRGLWQSVGKVSENLNRVALAKHTLAKGGSPAEAAYQAYDITAFSRSGGAMQPLIRTIPFLNARLQGLYRLYRGARSDDLNGWRSSFLAKGSMLAMATIALAMLNEDEEEYERLPDWDKDVNWHFFIDGKHYRFPKPFEVGVIFGTMPERMYRAIRGQDDADTFKQVVGRAVFETFAFNPVPQVVKPVVESYMNRSFFTGNPIVNLSMAGVEPEAQAFPWTSETAKIVADLAPDWAPDWARSPIRLEHLVRGFFGTMGLYALDMSDVMARKVTGAPAQPAMRPEDLPGLYRFYRGDPDLAKSSRYAEEIYKALGDANSIYRTINRYTAEGEPEKARALWEQNKGVLAWRKTLNDISTELRKLNKVERAVMRNPMLDAQEKRARLDRLIRTRNNLLDMYGPRIDAL